VVTSWGQVIQVRGDLVVAGQEERLRRQVALHPGG
jgi:hypothetical protein